MRSYLEPDPRAHTRARDRQRQLRDRFHDTMRGRAQNKLLEPLEDNLKDVTPGVAKEK